MTKSKILYDQYVAFQIKLFNLMSDILMKLQRFQIKSFFGEVFSFSKINLI